MRQIVRIIRDGEALRGTVLTDPTYGDVMSTIGEFVADIRRVEAPAVLPFEFDVREETDADWASTL